MGLRFRKVIPMNQNYITILNYPGSKKRLLPFINKTIKENLNEGKTILDIFTGTGAVAYSLKDNYKVIANDAEIFSYHMSNSLLTDAQVDDTEGFILDFSDKYYENYNKLEFLYPEIKNESKLIEQNEVDNLIDFYKNHKCFSDDKFNKRSDQLYSLFVEYYSNTYFGIRHSIQLDSLAYAISFYKDDLISSILYSCLYFAMKEIVFSKDGHMAQPLNFNKNKNRLLRLRKKDPLNLFFEKFREFHSTKYVKSTYPYNSAYNLTLDQILESNILEDVDLIYADPPYTDMQYSRYYHLLETATRYDYPDMTYNRGKVTTGLYRENRFQSPLSQFSKAKYDIEKLIKISKEKNIILVFSFAYPIDPKKQQTNRYTININELIELMENYYGKNKVEVLNEEYQHSNNRNSSSKKVYEYLIVGKI